MVDAVRQMTDANEYEIAIGVPLADTHISVKTELYSSLGILRLSRVFTLFLIVSATLLALSHSSKHCQMFIRFLFNVLFTADAQLHPDHLYACCCHEDSTCLGLFDRVRTTGGVEQLSLVRPEKFFQDVIDGKYSHNTGLPC